MSSLLNENDKAAVEAQATHGSTPFVRRRAQVLLLYDEGLPTREVASRVGLSLSQTRHWRRRYQSQGFGIFADVAPDAVPSEKTEASETGEIEPVPSGHYPATLRQAEHRRDLALALFDGTYPLHQLEGDQRKLLEAAALMQHLAQPRQSSKEVDGGPMVEGQTKAGRLFILSHPLAKLNPDEQKTIETILEHQHGGNKRYSGDQLGEVISSTDRTALVLAALLRVAEGLDASGDQKTQIVSVHSDPKQMLVRIDGSMKDVRAARKKAGLWSALFDLPIHVQLDRSEKESQTKEGMELLLSKKSPGVEATDTLAEAGRKVMGYHFAEMVRHESGTRQGEDIEELHDMRVATRRMRAAFEVFEDSFTSKGIKPHLKGLRATGRALGRVRDLDVFMEKAGHYLESLPKERRSGLDPLLAGWRQEREKDRLEMLSHLDSSDYASFKRRFQTFLTTPGASVKEISPTIPHLVRDVLPVLVYSRLAAVRAFGPVLDSATIEQLHALRIEFKKLRYTLEFFREVLGGEAKALIEEIKILQDHLGDLNDADVACHILREFLDEWENRQLLVPIDERDDPEPIVAYLATRHAERHRLMVTFGQAWGRFDQPEIRARFAAAVSVL